MKKSILLFLSAALLVSLTVVVVRLRRTPAAQPTIDNQPQASNGREPSRAPEPSGSKSSPEAITTSNQAAPAPTHSAMDLATVPDSIRPVCDLSHDLGDR